MDLLEALFPVPTWLLLTVVVAVLYTYYMSYNQGIFKKMGVPCPKPLPIIGNALFVLKHGLFNTVLLGYNYYKGNQMYGTFEGRTPVLTVMDFEMVQEIMIKQFNCFTDRRRYASMDQKGIDSIMFNKVGQNWKEYRNLLKPALNPVRLKHLYPRLKEPCLRMLDVIEKKIAVEPEVEISEILGCLCMDLVADFGFDVKMDSLNDPNHEYVDTAKKILHVFGDRTFFFEFFAPPFIKPLLDLLGIMLLPKKELYYFREMAHKAVAARRRLPKSQRPDDFLQYMIDLKDEAPAGKRTLTEEEIIGASMTYLIAGYDTSAKGFYYAMYQLAMNPECFKKAQKEIDDVLQGEFPDRDNIQKLNYLEQCIHEANRIIPLGMFVERTCVQETTVKGHRIPQGMCIRIPIAGFHFDPDIFPDPNRFDPDRFTPEAIKSRHAMSYMPFGGGPRACFGRPMAMMIIKIGMATLIQRFNMGSCAKSEYPIRLMALSDVLPDHLLWLKISSRTPPASAVH